MITYPITLKICRELHAVKGGGKRKTPNVVSRTAEGEYVATPAPEYVDDLPDDIVDAVGRMVYTRYAERQRDPLIKSEQIDGVGRTDYLIPSSGGNLSPDVEDILRAYRVPVVV